jgi:medium-chain acyl-[acyl-carrier-protein] hydrolase
VWTHWGGTEASKVGGAGIIVVMKSTIGHTMSSWVSISPSRSRKLGRLFCLPFAGGGALAYYRWPSLISAGFEVARVHLPGRETRLREPLFTRLASLVDTLVEELIPWIDGPFAIYGHSMGALLAFELARELRRRYSLSPVHLFVSGYRAPQLPPSELPFSHLPDADFINRIRQYGGVPDLIAQNEELMEIFLPILRADLEMAETYVYREEPPLECPLTAFGGLSDPKVDREKIIAWDKHTSMGFSAHFFPGGHFFLHDSEPLVLNQINLQLNESLLIRINQVLIDKQN